MTSSIQQKLPTELFLAEDCRAFDRILTEEFKIPSLELMQNAGRVAFETLRTNWPDAQNILVLAGNGNNGGDAWELAKLAYQARRKVTVRPLGDHSHLPPDAAICRQAYLATGGIIDDNAKISGNYDVIVDGIFGTGLTRDITDPIASVIQQVNAQSVPVLALDMPSGVHADTGSVLGIGIQATITITFIALKIGFFLDEGCNYRGKLLFDSLGAPDDIYLKRTPVATRFDWQEYAPLLNPRRPAAHKGDFGHVLLIGGAPGYGGAIRLAGEAALRSGAGLVTIATHPANVTAINAARPELIVHGIDTAAQLIPLLAGKNSVGIGPGLAQTAWSRMLWEQIPFSHLPVVVDADALNLLARKQQRLPTNWIMTPHPGEASRLLGCQASDINRQRKWAAETLRRNFGCIAVLKGAGTIVQQSEIARPSICSGGNPGMAIPGSGDVLTGIIAALLAQGYTSNQAARFGVALHAGAGDLAAKDGQIGMLAGDIITALRPLLRQQGF